jgi:hypothetical protein
MHRFLLADKYTTLPFYAFIETKLAHINNNWRWTEQNINVVGLPFLKCNNEC